MNFIWWGLTILLVLGSAILAIVVFLGGAAFFVVSIVEYLEAKLGIVTIGKDEEELIERAKKLKEEQRKAFKGPWTLTPKVRPYSSKVFHFLKAKEMLEKRYPEDP